MPLTTLQIKKIQPRTADYWVSDEKGLRLLIKPSGAKYWRMKYRFHGKQKTLSLGVFPEVGLKEARIARDKARIQISEGIDPNEDKKLLKRQEMLEGNEAFSTLAREWFEQQKGTWDERHSSRLWNRLAVNSFEELDKIPLEKIKPQDILFTIRKIEDRGALDVAARTLQDIRRVFRYAIQTGRLTQNPAGDLTGVIKARRTKHRASLPTNELGQFLCDLQQYKNQGRLLTQLAIELLVLTFVRPAEVRGARWSEFDYKEKLWRIPAERMKMKTPHLVPLSRQSLSVIEQIKPISSQYDLVFPSERNRSEAISENTMRRALFRLGYDGTIKGKSRVTPHGFRANASSILNEKGFNADAIERQLSHIERNKVRSAYTHHAHYLDERKEIMQWWADFLAGEAEKYRHTKITSTV